MQYAGLDLVSVCYVQHEFARPSYLHINDDLHLIHVLEGGLSIRCSGQKKRAGKETIIYIPPLTEYALGVSSSGVEMLNFHFYFKIDGSIPFETKYRFPLTFSVPDFSLVRSKLFEMKKAWQYPSLAGTIKALVSACELVAYYLETQPFVPVQTEDDDLMNQLRLQLSHDRSSHFEAQHWADFVNLSISQMNRRFRNAFNISPGRYWKNCQLHRAQNMLLKTRIPISNIASILGFEDQNYFSRWFKSSVQFSPRDYRREAGKNLLQL